MNLPTALATPPCLSPLARALLLSLTLLAAAPSQALAQGRTDTVALFGQSAPGAGAGTFSFFDTPVLNDAGQTAFFSLITGGSGTEGIYRSSSGSTLTAIALQGQSDPGAGAGTFSGFSFPSLNDAGQTAFRGFTTGGSSTEGIYRSSSGNTLTAIARQGQSAPGAGGRTFSSFNSPALNNAGQIAFSSTLIFGGSTTQGIYRSSSGSTLTAIALQGQSAPGAGAGTFSSLGSSPVLNDTGQTAFFSSITGGSSTQGIYRSSSGNTLTAIALQGQSAIGAGVGTFSFLGNAVLNNTGQTAFEGFITGGTSTSGIYRSSSGSTLTAIALQGQSATGAGAGTFSSFGDPVLNDNGQTAFLASITGGTSTSGIYRSSSGITLTAIALQGQSAPGTGAGTFSGLDNPRLNDTGQIAFEANMTGGTSTNGLYVADGRDTVAAQLQGSTLAGKTVSSLSFVSGGFNRHGQLAYRASFTDITQGNFLFTPALRWRESFSSNWDTADRWTLGITPGSVHDVSIDPSVALTVTGPAGAVNVRSLTVGGGTGFAILNLGGGTLTSASVVQIASRGILAGSGSIATQVVNAGEVRADNLILGGGLVNNGTVRGAVTYNQRIDTNLTNNPGGVVRVDEGETLKLVGTAHSNSGNFELRGGEMQITGATTNNNAGRILFNGNGGIARFNGGLINNGQVQVSFGSAELFGAVTTNAGGKIILTGNSNTTFYDAVDVKSGGELRISTGSTGVFFGLVNQRTGSLFTGSGSKFYEGGLSVGASPGVGSDAGNVSFGAGNQYLADIGGTTAGTGFDFYDVKGTLTFGGTLKLVSWNSFVAQAGQSFDLFDWGSAHGKFDSIDSSGFVLAAGTQLDTSQLYVDGSVGVQAVPEPESYALLLAGLGLVGFVARRRKFPLSAKF